MAHSEEQSKWKMEDGRWEMGNGEWNTEIPSNIQDEGMDCPSSKSLTFAKGLLFLYLVVATTSHNDCNIPFIVVYKTIYH
jgi:hypothetical protein